MVGYCGHTTAYRLIDLKSLSRVEKLREVVFVENIMDDKDNTRGDSNSSTNNKISLNENSDIDCSK